MRSRINAKPPAEWIRQDVEVDPVDLAPLLNAAGWDWTDPHIVRAADDLLLQSPRTWAEAAPIDRVAALTLTLVHGMWTRGRLSGEAMQDISRAVTAAGGARADNSGTAGS